VIRKDNANFSRRRSAKVDPLQQAIDRTVAHVRRMTPEELRMSLINAGILTRNGRLTPPYR